MFLVPFGKFAGIKGLRQTVLFLHSNTQFQYHHTKSLSMQFKLVTLTTLALAAFAAATPTPAPRADGDGQCATGPIQCCDTTTTATDPLVSVILSLLGIVLPDLTAIIGINCSPLTIIGVGGSEWWVKLSCRWMLTI